jgi:hypothetical protein
MDIVYAQSNGHVQLQSGAVAKVQKGQHWPATDQVVRMRPELFTTDPRYGLVYTEAPTGHDGELNEVEEATANPGEKRSVRRG